MYKIYQGHILDNISQLRNNSIDLIITSPPYWGLRDYGIVQSFKTKPQAIEWQNLKLKEYNDSSSESVEFVESGISYNEKTKKWTARISILTTWNDGWKGQFGLEPSFKLYIKHLIEIFEGLKRKLKDTGSLWINLGDTYAGGNLTVGQPKNWESMSTKNRDKYDGDDFETFIKARNKLKEVKDKSKIFIPERFAIAMVDNGWICRNEIIWHKPSCMPSSAKDRFTVDFEKFLFFTKQEKYFFKQQFESMAKSSISRLSQNIEQQVGSGRVHAGNKPNEDGKMKAVGDIEKGRNMRAVWSINPKGFKEAHFATYPEKLISVPIDACCKIGGIVLDPFSGSGTSGIVTIKQGKRYIGFEINPEYVLMSEERLEGVHTLYKSKRNQTKDFL